MIKTLTMVTVMSLACVFAPDVTAIDCLQGPHSTDVICTTIADEPPEPLPPIDECQEIMLGERVLISTC